MGESDGTVIVGRSMDVGEDMNSNMWVQPPGMQRDGRGGKNTVSWESKLGSPVVTAHDIVRAAVQHAECARYEGCQV